MGQSLTVLMKDKKNDEPTIKARCFFGDGLMEIILECRQRKEAGKNCRPLIKEVHAELKSSWRLSLTSVKNQFNGSLAFSHSRAQSIVETLDECGKMRLADLLRVTELSTIRKELQASFGRCLQGTSQPPGNGRRLIYRFLLWTFVDLAPDDEDSRQVVREMRTAHGVAFRDLITSRSHEFQGGKEEEFRRLLKKLCHSFLPEINDLDEFIDAPCDDADNLETRLRELRVDEKRRGSGLLAGWIRDYKEFLQMRDQWKEVIAKLPQDDIKVLLDPQKTEGCGIVERLYSRANIQWNTQQTDAFTAGHFEDEVWRKEIITPQPDPGQEKRHIHKANYELARALASDDPHVGLLGRLQVRPGDRRPYPLWVAEGGVGGGNTIYSICRALREACGGDNKPPFPHIRYRGFELNRAYAERANLFLDGNDPQEDKRTMFFRELRSPGAQSEPLLRPLPISAATTPFRGPVFVQSGNMADEIAELAMCREGIQLDVFVSSYAVHHVPNPLRLLRYFDVLSKSDLDAYWTPTQFGSFKLLGRDERLSFFKSLIAGLKLLRDSKDPFESDSVPDELARVVLSHLPFARGGTALSREIYPDALPRGALETILRDVEHQVRLELQPQGPDKHWRPEWMNRALADRQMRLYADVFRLLKPGGILALADPDGYSMFNRKMILESAEMAVAYFRTRAQVERLLSEVGFEVISAVTQVQGAGEGEFVLSKASPKQRPQSTGVEDWNRGYIVLARKPTPDRESAWMPLMTGIPL
jgi:hypothetical protein